MQWVPVAPKEGPYQRQGIVEVAFPAYVRNHWLPESRVTGTILLWNSTNQIFFIGTFANSLHTRALQRYLRPFL